MSDDLLAQMTQALRDEHDGATAVPEATRARVIRTLSERKPRRRKWLAVGIPLFVVFGGSTAWAAASGKLTPIVQQAFSVFTEDSVEDEKQAPVEPKQKTARPHAEPNVPEAVVPATEEPKQQEPEEDTAEPANPVVDASVSPIRQPRAPQNKRASTEPPSREDRERTEEISEDHTSLLLYRNAHRSQFSQGDCVSAIAGYELYLRLYAKGPFAVDARYNRGVCLIRMGRHQEAHDALLPFAQGRFGNYRKSESQRLLDAMTDSAESAEFEPQAP